VLDQRPFERVEERAWVFRTIGRVHGPGFWSDFVAELRAVGYDGALSIENEDASQTHVEGVEEAAAFILPLLGATD
jgi:DNA-(apurinic or apyrimidinic site) lyase